MKIAENLAKLGILELYVFYLYTSLKQQVLVSAQLNSANLSTPNFEFMLDKVENLIADEKEDLRNVIIHMERELDGTSVDVAASHIIRMEIEGAFFSLRRTDVRQQLFKSFIEDASRHQNTAVHEFLSRLAEEEKEHEAILEQFVRILDRSEKFTPWHMTEIELRSYLRLCHAAFFCGASASDPVNYILDIAKGEDSIATLWNVVRLAEGIYWSYCVGTGPGL